MSTSHSCHWEFYNPVITGQGPSSLLSHSHCLVWTWGSDTGVNWDVDRQRLQLTSLWYLLFPSPIPAPLPCHLSRMNLSSACRRSPMSYREHMHTTLISQLSTTKLMRQSDIWRKLSSSCAQPHSGSRSPGSIRLFPGFLSLKLGATSYVEKASLLSALCQQVVVPRDYLVVVWPTFIIIVMSE